MRFLQDLATFVDGAETRHLKGDENVRGGTMEPTFELGIVKLQSRHSVDETVARIQEILKSKGITLFAVIDHSGQAREVGLSMPNTKLLIFGHPKGGTPIMMASPSAALDLPLKLLVAEDVDGRAWVSYNSTNYLQSRHGFGSELARPIAVIEDLARIAVG
jgi:uncharacterized protein (DUF302 family)